MALTHADFMSYPLLIVGIDLSQTVGETITYLYDEKIQAIENFVVSDIAYTGEASDIAAVLPYFVFFYFCQDAASTTFAETGENVALKKYTIPSIDKRVRAWDIGAELLNTICSDESTTAKAKYLKGMNFFI